MEVETFNPALKREVIKLNGLNTNASPRAEVTTIARSEIRIFPFLNLGAAFWGWTCVCPTKDQDFSCARDYVVPQLCLHFTGSNTHEVANKTKKVMITTRSSSVKTVKQINVYDQTGTPSSIFKRVHSWKVQHKVTAKQNRGSVKADLHVFHSGWTYTIRFNRCRLFYMDHWVGSLSSPPEKIKGLQ